MGLLEINEYTTYYVYTHSINGDVFYVGSNWSKGNQERAYETNGRPEKWHEFVNANNMEYEVRIVSRHTSSIEAHRAEYKMIEEYHDIGLAEASGEDQRGSRNPMWGRKGKLSPFYGKERPESVKKKISEANKGRCVGSKSVLSKAIEMTAPSGEKTVFGSLSECVAHLGGVNKAIISAKANSGDVWTPRKKHVCSGSTFRYMIDKA